MLGRNYAKLLPHYRNYIDYIKMEKENFYYDSEIEHITEIVKNRLYFASTYSEDTRCLQGNNETYYFTTDEELIYMNYYFDFGPLNLSCLFKFCCKLNSYLCSPTIKRIIYYTSSDVRKRANAAFLIGSYAVIYLEILPRRIYQVLIGAGGVYKNFVDASQGNSTYTLRLLDCFQAVEKARAFNFFDFDDFNILEYDTYDKIQNGDMNWLLPRKFLAFIGPTDCEFMNGHAPEFYLKYFVRNDIKTVIRLNNKVYDANAFTQSGINHHDLFFADGTTPSKHILLRFLEVSEHSPAAIAVHCKAGLGRTGSLIGAYIIKHYHMSAREAIAWMRICRPGSVIGQQQGWLEKIEPWLWKQGNLYRTEHFGDGDKIPRHRYGVYSKEWPNERKRLIMLAQKNTVGCEEQQKFRMPSPQRFSAPSQKEGLLTGSKPKRPESERKRTSADRERELYRFSKFMSKAQVISDENKVEKGMSRARHVNCQTDSLKTLKNLNEVDAYRKKKHKDKSEGCAGKTQGDRLNDIKAKRFNETKEKLDTGRVTWSKPEQIHHYKKVSQAENPYSAKNNVKNFGFYMPSLEAMYAQKCKRRIEANSRPLVKNVSN